MPYAEDYLSPPPRPRRPALPDPLATNASIGSAPSSAPAITTAPSSSGPRVTAYNGTPVRYQPTVASFTARPDRYVTTKGQLRAKYLGGEEGQEHRQQKAEKRLTRLLAKPYSGLDASQSNILNTVLSTGLKRGATGKELLAATETGLVESNLSNPNQASSDLDSAGWRQERASIYGTGKKGPQNVRASARRLFDELRSDPGTQSAATAGQLAQAAQGSAYPERYDERQAEASGLLDRFLGRVDRSGADIGDVQAPVQRERKVPTLIQLGKRAQRKFGVEAREHPFFDPVDPVHTEGSMHYSGDAIDFQGDPNELMSLDKWLARKYGSKLDELFYDPGVSIADGQPTGSIGGHSDHLHLGLSIGQGESRTATGSSGAMAGPTGFGAAASTPGGAIRPGGPQPRPGVNPLSFALSARAARPMSPLSEHPTADDDEGMFEQDFAAALAGGERFRPRRRLR